MQSPKSAALYMGDGEVPFGDLTINGNTFVGGGSGGNTSAAMICRTSQGTNAKIGRIRNNILIGGQANQAYGFYEDNQTSPKTCEPTEYENNAVYDVDHAHRRWDGYSGSVLTTVAEVNNLGFATGNIAKDCQLDNTMHLGGQSPCIDAGVMTEASDHDIDGEQRPQGGGVDIGADEAG